MKKILLIFSFSMILLSFQSITAQTDTVLVKTIKINLTAAGAASGGEEWNDFSLAVTDSTYALKDSTGTLIAYTFYNEDEWGGERAANGVAGGPYPDPVCMSNWQIQQGNIADIELRNLNNNSLYYLEFFGAREVDGLRVTDVTIGDSTSSFQACYNTSEKAIFNNVHPTEGVIRASIKMNEFESDANWAYLGAIVIREYSVSTGINDLLMPDHSNLLSNFPNPFKEETSIKYKIPVAGSVCLNVYDAMGKEVTNLIRENQPSGEYNRNWNVAGLSSGLYFLRMTIQPDGYVIPIVSVRKIVVAE